MNKLPIAFLFTAMACTTSPDVVDDDVAQSLVESCTTGTDNTAVVQAAMAAGTCLPAGTYNVDMAPYDANGRRRDSMLTGALCGSGQSTTAIRFRGDAHALLWAGITLTSNSTLANIRLNSECVTNTIEQTHLVRMVDTTDHVSVHDVVLQHPKRTDGKPAGDCIYVVGNLWPYTATHQPNHDLQISHATFEACARGGVQVSRGLDGLKILDSSFASSGFDIGSEGAGARTAAGVVTRSLSNVEIGRNTFTAPTSLLGGYSIEMQYWQTASIHHNTSDSRPLIAVGSDGLAFANNHFTSRSTRQLPVLNIENEGHDITSTSDTFTQMESATPTDVIRVSPHDGTQQADLVNFTFTNPTLEQTLAADFITLVGVTGFTMSGATLVYTGPSTRTPASIVPKTSPATPPVTPVPTTGVTETGSTHVGF